MHCYFCHHEVVILDRVGRQDRCDACGRDLHICRNCDFFDPKAYNECRESAADRVVDKEAANFCDYFSPSFRTYEVGEVDPLAVAKKKLEEMFKK